MRVTAEVLHAQGLNDEHILRMNWPLFGVGAGGERLDAADFVVTADEFGAEQFVRVQLHGRDAAPTELRAAAQQQAASSETRVVCGSGGDEVREWLESLGMAQYWALMKKEGFESMDMVRQIKDSADLEYVGVRRKAHQMKLKRSE